MRETKRLYRPSIVTIVIDFCPVFWFCLKVLFPSERKRKKRETNERNKERKEMNKTKKEETKKTRIKQKKERKKDRKVRDSMIDTNDTIYLLYVLTFTMTPEWEEDRLVLQEDGKTSKYQLQRPHIPINPPNSLYNV